MIEKIMKVVKRGNKRRGRNITIGAVIGFLLSCTAVMGAGDYLWIKEDSGEIKFSTDSTKEDNGDWKTDNPYENAGNIWDKDTEPKTYTYTNNITLSSSEKNGEDRGSDISYGLRLSGDLTGVNFVNNGSITGKMSGSGSDDGYGFGIYNTGAIGNIANAGEISGTGSSSSGSGSGYGIINNSGIMGKIENTGLISGIGSSSSGAGTGSGIFNINNVKKMRNIINEMGNITNTGVISGTGSSSSGTGIGYGIYNSAKMGNITNTGLISGSGTGSNNISEGSGIYNKSGTIGAITNAGLISGSGSSSSSSSSSYGIGYGIYNSAIMGAITNTGEISGSGNSSGGNFGYGIINNSGTMENVTNTGVISGIGSSSNSEGTGPGIYNQSGKIGDITNAGVISGIGNSTGATSEGSGIYNHKSEMENITNTGIISGSGTGSNNISNGFGIRNYKSEIKNITNTGLISGYATSTSAAFAYGINNDSNDKKMGAITNTGIISGYGNGESSSTGYGIYNGSPGTMGAITNTGVIYGKTNAIKNDKDFQNSIGTITATNNYGILVNGDDGEKVVDGLNIDTSAGKNKIVNKGLIFTALDGGGYKAEEDEYGKFGQTFDNGAGITIINAKAIDGKPSNIDTEKNIVGTESLELKKGILTTGDSQTINISPEKRYILNGITNTLKVSGKNNELNDSVINAYETAVVMDSDDSTLILNNTVVNGGLSGNDSVISITGNQNILTIQGNSVVNGEMESTGENNTLSLNGNAEDGMSMLHNISGFVNMNIDNNVTFFEDVEVTGTKKVTIAETGTLNLRLKNTEETVDVNEKPIPKASHAFLGNEMVIQGEGNGKDTAGTLRFITNGIGQKIYVDMKNIELRNLHFKTSSVIDGYDVKDKEYIILGAHGSLNGIYKPENTGKDGHRYEALNNIYKGIYSSTDDNLNALRVLISSNEKLGNNYDENLNDEEQLKNLLSYLGSIYTETPYSFSSELSRKSTGMFRDIITENQFKPNLNQWLVMGGLTHRDGGTKDSYYGQNYHGFDTGTADVDVDMKLTGAYALGKYGYSENVSLGVTTGGNKSEAKLPMSKVKGNSGYVGAFAENYRGNLTLKAGAGIQYSEYDANRATLGGHSYSEKYSDMTYDIYLNGRYSHNIGENLFLEPYGTLSYTYIKQDSADEGSKVLAIETNSKSFDYTAAKVGVDLKKVIPHEKGKSTLSAGVSYTRLLTGADEENITGRFKGGSDFDILVAHKNEHSIGLNAKYALELENGILFDVKGSYSLERDSHKGIGKNRNKGEWIVGAGIGYKF